MHTPPGIFTQHSITLQNLDSSTYQDPIPNSYDYIVDVNALLSGLKKQNGARAAIECDASRKILTLAIVCLSKNSPYNAIDCPQSLTNPSCKKKYLSATKGPAVKRECRNYIPYTSPSSSSTSSTSSSTSQNNPTSSSPSYESSFSYTPSSSQSSPKGGVIAGAIIGSVALIAIIVAIVCIIRRKQRSSISDLPTAAIYQKSSSPTFTPAVIPQQSRPPRPPAPAPIRNKYTAYEPTYANPNNFKFASKPPSTDSYTTNTTSNSSSILSSRIGTATANRILPSGGHRYNGHAMSSPKASFPTIQEQPSVNSLNRTSSVQSNQQVAAGHRSFQRMQSFRINFNEIDIDGLVGEGSYGKVYKGKWNETDVAVKILVDYTDSIVTADRGSRLLANLQEEAGLMAMMRHPNIVQFMGISTNPPAIITEYCSRISLYDVLQKAKRNPTAVVELTWQRRMQMLADAVRGMIHLHMMNPPIVHRDLKSLNLLVTADLRIKVSDFNLSKIVKDGTLSQHAASAAESNLMNPRWLAPEVINGSRYSVATDIFSFGVVMWEMLVWEAPWGNKNDTAIRNEVKKGSRLLLPEYHDLPGIGSSGWNGLADYITLMERCWAQDPDMRPKSFHDVMKALRDIDPKATA